MSATALAALTAASAVLVAALGLRHRAGFDTRPVVNDAFRTGAFNQRWVGFKARRENGKVQAQLPDLLDHLARAVRGGGSLRSALLDAPASFSGLLGSDLRRVGALLDSGDPLQSALDSWARWRRVEGLGLTVSALGIAQHAGGSVARAIDGVAATLREDLRIHREVGALASQAKASAVLIGGLPLVFGGAAAATDPRTLHFLVGTRLGWSCLVAALLLDVAGLFWMRRIVTGVVA